MTRVPALVLAAAWFASGASLRGEPVPVRHPEGSLHGFLALRTLDGATIADGDLIQTAHGTRVTARLTFRFKDGSLHDETAVFSQRGAFRLIRDHLVQKGPSFPQALDMTIEAASGTVTVRYADGGDQKTDTEHLRLPPDLANGLVLTLLKNVTTGDRPERFSFVAATPKPRLVALSVTSAGDERFATGTESRKATHYVVKIDLGGVTGVLAKVFGKQPPDSQVWVLGGTEPAFVKSEQQLYPGGPVWRIELVAPVWPGNRDSAPK